MEPAQPAVNHKKKTLIVTIIAAVIAIAAIVLAIVLINRQPVINDDYFVSDNEKYVITLEDNTYGAKVTHHVAHYNSNDEITKLEAYYEFEDEEAAKTVFNELKDLEESGLENIDIALNGKYIVENRSLEDLSMTASEFKQWIDFYEAYTKPEGGEPEEDIEPSDEETNEL